MKIEEKDRQRSKVFQGGRQNKPCIREKNPDYVILHVWTNELNFELPPEGIAKSFIDTAKKTQINNRIVKVAMTT